MDISHNVTPDNHSFEIILGSSSKARRQILAEMGYKFTVVTADIDEKNIRKEKPEDLVMALAEAKADAIMTRLKNSGQLEQLLRPTLLITADTVVVCRGIIREKPSSEEEARQFIRDYSGASAQVVGSVVVTNLVTGTRKSGFDSAEVYFLDIPDEVVDDLIKEGINFNVAGGLTLERALTLPLVDTVVGSVDCINGLSKTLTEKLIHEVL
ncbi:putative nucleic acid-binding protein ASMTL [Handroanthus impetiginosus]|uniref:Putative nucleic acid-binding protein ASMTL n=1 Tax=Handroanthus impetiginosus TaxID=429701 RepID=A0A2G9HY32_9LAMI|nr:putative nucleic acid-binding protein ASMTL [Handroanthus impetiginosus]